MALDTCDGRFGKSAKDTRRLKNKGYLRWQIEGNQVLEA